MGNFKIISRLPVISITAKVEPYEKFYATFSPGKVTKEVGGPHNTVDSILASRLAAPGSNLGISKIFSERFSLSS